jgi:hypothetical protein
MIELNVDRPWFERINVKALGDDVVKVEAIHGDETRTWVPFVGG